MTNIHDFIEEHGEENVLQHADGTVTIRKVLDGNDKRFSMKHFAVDDAGFAESKDLSWYF